MKIYLIATLRERNTDKPLKYRVLDIESKEMRDVSRDALINAIKANSWAFENIKISSMQATNEKQIALVLDTAICKIPTLDVVGVSLSAKRYIMISISELTSTVRLAECDGTIVNIDLVDLYDMRREVAYVPIKYRKRLIKDWATTRAEKIFRDEIDKLHTEFIALTRTLGIDCSFVYFIQGKDVYLGSYTGTSKHAIVPKFITIIKTRAFYRRNITHISLNEGLQTIEMIAFAFNNLTEVDIPKTVTIVDKQAFYGNNGLFKKIRTPNGETIERLDKDKFRVYSNNTKVWDQA